MLEGGEELLVDDLVGLGEVLAALGVADEGVGRADGEKLADRGFAGVCAFLGEVHVLATDCDVGPGSGGDDGGQQNGRRKQCDLVARVPSNEWQKGLDEGLGFSGSLVHLPIGGNECGTGHVFWVPRVQF